MNTRQILRGTSLVFFTACCLSHLANLASAKEIDEPKLFTTNCKACHTAQTDLVGPSLVEIARLYPQGKREQFVKWCVEPGKKRDDKVQMPSMAHIPKKDLEDIHKYILTAARGLSRIRMPQTDPFEKSTHYTKRPRVFRIFLPDTGPASLIIALPTKKLHNIIWDTDKCALRYITTGEPDGYKYWKSNGNSEAKPGTKCYTESQTIFDPKQIQYLGYEISKDGYPTFHYSVGNVKLTESYRVKNEVIHRVLKSDAAFPKHQLGKSQLDKSKKIKRVIKQEGNALTIQYEPNQF